MQPEAGNDLGDFCCESGNVRPIGFAGSVHDPASDAKLAKRVKIQLIAQPSILEMAVSIQECHDDW